MTQLGIARVIQTKGEPAKPVAKKVAAKPIAKEVKPNVKKVQPNSTAGRAITINIHNHNTPAPVATQRGGKPKRARIKRVGVVDSASSAKLKTNATPKLRQIAPKPLRQSKPIVKKVVKPSLATKRTPTTKVVKPIVKRPTRIPKKRRVGLRVAKGAIKVISSPIRLPAKGIRKVFMRKKRK